MLKTNLKYSLFIALILFLCLGAAAFFIVRAGGRTCFALAGSQDSCFSGSVGEKITYDVILGKLSLGKAYFERLADTDKEGRKLNLIVFETRLASFKDKEVIYSDPATFLPAEIYRDINKMLGSERISEVYDQDKFTLSITKDAAGKVQKTLIKKDGPIQNAVLLPFYVRRIADLRVGSILRANLPKCQFIIKLVRVEGIRVPAGDFQAYYFESQPAQFKIWISADTDRIPLKIQGTGVFGYTMVMRKRSL